MSSSDVITLNFSQPDFTATNGTQYKTIIGLGNKVNNIGNLVVWAEITPSASSQLQWSNNVFGVYATTVKNDQMNLVFVNSQEPASLGSSFSWNGSYFDTYGNNSDPYSISITNKSQSNWTLGLTVQNSNNANIPINAATVIPNQTISIKAPDTLYIRFGHDYDLLNIITNYGTDYFQQFNIVPDESDVTVSTTAGAKTYVGFGSFFDNLVVWEQINPATTNTLSWSPVQSPDSNVNTVNYGVFASTSSSLTNGQFDVITFQTAASLGTSYIWDGTTFAVKGTISDRNSIEIINDTRTNWTLGVTKINSSNTYNPILGDVFLPGVDAIFKLEESKIHIYYGTSSNINITIPSDSNFTIDPGTTYFKLLPQLGKWLRTN